MDSSENTIRPVTLPVVNAESAEQSGLLAERMSGRSNVRRNHTDATPGNFDTMDVTEDTLVRHNNKEAKVAKSHASGKMHSSKNSPQRDEHGRPRKEDHAQHAAGSLVQLIMPHPEISCAPGLCLVYVRETFGIGPKYPTATAGWKASTHKHADQNFPEGIWVPLWFSMKDNPDGHVALRQPDGSIWSASHPTATMPVHHPSLADLESYYGGRLKYRGWTEDLEGVRIARRSEP